MNLSAEFKNSAYAGLALLPTIIAASVSIYLVGAPALIPLLIGAMVSMPVRNLVSNAGFDPSKLHKLDVNSDIRLRDIAKNMGFSKIPPTYENPSNRRNACAAYNNIVIESEIFEYFNDSEIEFIFAHELAHIKRKDGLMQRAAQTALWGGVFATIGHIVAATYFGDAGSAFKVASAFSTLVFAASLPFTFGTIFIKDRIESNHEMEFDCDRRAVLATGNIDAGISALSKLKTHWLVDDLDSESHPALNARIEALQDLKREQEIGVTLNSAAMPRSSTARTSRRCLQLAFA